MAKPTHDPRRDTGAERPGAVIDGRFTLQEKLASGGFGTVWRASDRAAGGADIAIKILHPRERNKPWVVERFAREAEILARVDHPNIARITSWSVAGPSAYLAMEYVEGVTLDQALLGFAEAGAPPELGLVADLLDALADALRHAHDRKIVHRDLKPRNIIVQIAPGALSVKLLDFGIAKILEGGPSEATTVGRLLGSVLYMSPEQIRGEPVDPRTDVFALGTVLFELLTLCRCWARDPGGAALPIAAGPVRRDAVNNHVSIMRRITTGDRPSLGGLRPELSPEVEEALGRALRLAPDDRTPSVEELAEGFRRAAAVEKPKNPEHTWVLPPTVTAQSTPFDGQSGPSWSGWSLSAEATGPARAPDERVVAGLALLALSVAAGLGVLVLRGPAASGVEPPAERVEIVPPPHVPRAEEPPPPAPTASSPPAPVAPSPPPTPDDRPAPLPPTPRPSRRAERPPTPDLAARAPRPKAAPSPPPAGVKEPDPIEPLVRAAEANPADLALLRRAADAIEARAAAIDDPAVRRSVQMCAVQSQDSADLGKLRACHARLLRALGR